MELDWFKNLSSLAQTGNFSQAAEISHLSQSAFSRRIKALEDWVGTRLVDRSAHPVKLTQAGRQILEAGTQAISRIEAERTQILESLEQPDRYVVTFGAQHSIGWRFFPSWLQAFEQAFGPIMSRLRADNLPNCINDLKQGEVDFVVSYESKRARGVDDPALIESLMIGRDVLIPVCKTTPNGIPLFDVRDSKATNIPYLRFGPTAPIGRHIDPLLRETGLSSRLTTVYENSMAGALRIRARDGLGVAWLPKSLVDPDLEAGLLSVAGDPSFAIYVEIHLNRLKRSNNQLTRKIWTFLKLREGAPLV